MFKKLLLFLPLALIVPVATGVYSDEFAPQIVSADGSDGKGEYDGYTYTQVGNRRYYDSTEFAPTIVKNFWAPNGYKFSLNLSDEQIDMIFTQAEAVGFNYTYINCTLSYEKFGVEVYYESIIYDLEGNKEATKEYLKDKINNAEPFYEIRESTVETDITYIFDFYFSCDKYVSEHNAYNFRFKGEKMVLQPFDQSDCIEFNLQYYLDDDGGRSEERVDIMCNPIKGFFNEEPYNNPYGFVTDTRAQRYSQDADGFIDGNVYRFNLYAYNTVEIADLNYYGVEMNNMPSRPLPCKIKLSFVSGGVEYSYWSKEFIFGDPEFYVTIDGYADRGSVQKNSSHLYGVSFANLNNSEFYSINAAATALPLRLDSQARLREYYDRAIEPDDNINYYLKSSFNNWERDENYTFVETSEGHFKLYNIPLTSGDEIRVHTTADDYLYYQNATAPVGCGYTIGGFWDDVTIIERGNYDIEFILDPADHNHIAITRVGDYDEQPQTEEDYYLVGTFNNWEISGSYKLNEDEYSNHYFLKNQLLHEGDKFQISDSRGNLYSTSENWDCSGFTIEESGKLVVTDTRRLNIDYYVKNSHKYNIVLSSAELENAPIEGEENYLFYIPSNEEVRLHKEGRDAEFLDKEAGGLYYIWNKEGSYYDYYNGQSLIDNMDINSEEGDIFDKTQISAIPYSGEWSIYFEVNGTTEKERFFCRQTTQTIHVVSGDDTEDTILLNVPDEVNILNGADKLTVTPSVSSYDPEVEYYYNWDEPTKEGIISIEETLDGIITITPINPGVTELTVNVECELFAEISKTISVRVLDAIYDVAKIQVPNEFHYAGKDLTASLSIRGFTKIQNIDVEWTVTNKNGKEIPQEKLVVNSDATITLLKADSEDYTFVAYYQGVKLDTLTVKVRLTDINKFLKTNVWWIFLLTIALVVFSALMRKLFKRGKTTVDNIQGVYDVFCKCISDDKLTLPELKIIKKELTKCVHRCEDLNIEALNQYEKAIRYLRKSLGDTNSLINKWDSLTPEDKSAFTERLNLDLAKALNVAREIENAKDLIEQYHYNANKKNYEVISDEGKTK